MGQDCVQWQTLVFTVLSSAIKVFLIGQIISIFDNTAQNIQQLHFWNNLSSAPTAMVQ
jgi:F0F1-type ATP synthase membrane subunit b/b'